MDTLKGALKLWGTMDSDKNLQIRNEAHWAYLMMGNKLERALNQSAIEMALPFGMQRNLIPISLDRRGSESKFKKLQPNDFQVIKDPLVSSFTEHQNRKLQPRQNVYESRIKFIPHRAFQDRPITTAQRNNALNNNFTFDPTALLFFKEEGRREFNKTNLTSNASGSVSGDKSHLGAVMSYGCWLLSSQDVANYSVIPPTLNNKIRSLKSIEFIAQELANLDGIGDAIEFVALHRFESIEGAKCSNYRKVSIIMSRLRRKINGQEMKLLILNCDGKIKFSSDDIKHCSASHLYKSEIELHLGDVVFLMRGSADVELRLISEALKCESLGYDFESEILNMLESVSSLSALIVSKVTKSMDFDESFNKKTLGDTGRFGLKHICHLDTKIGQLVKEPQPGMIGSTTRHSVIYRPNYFGALHHDASKINRFRDTINYVIRKVGDERNLNCRLEQEGSAGIFKRLSDIQYFAYLLLLPNGKIHLGLGGGAKCLVISKSTGIRLIEESILRSLENVQDADRILFLSPHFPTSKLLERDFIGSEEKMMKELLVDSQLNVNNFKLSMVLFEINAA